MLVSNISKFRRYKVTENMQWIKCDSQLSFQFRQKLHLAHISNIKYPEINKMILHQLKTSSEEIDFKEVISFIDKNYDFTPYSSTEIR